MLLKAARFCILVAAAVWLPFSAPADSLGPSNSAALVRQATVLVYSPLTQEMGTGFVVYSSGHQSYVVTAAHIVSKNRAIDVYVNGDIAHPANAAVVDLNKTYDLALLSVSAGAPAQVTFATGPVQAAQVGTLGYAAQSVSYWLRRTGELRSDVGFGHVTRVHEQGRRFDDTAPAFPGDSGSPIFSVSDGTVVGMVRGHHSKNASLAYEGVGSLAIRELLARHNIAFFGPPVPHSRAYAASHPYLGAIAGVRLLRDVPGAGQLLVVTRTTYKVDQNRQHPDYALENANLANGMVNQLHAQLGQLFGAEIHDESYDPGDDAALGRAAFERGDVGAVRVDAYWQVSNGLYSTMAATVAIRVVDKYGDLIASGAGEQRKHMVLADFDADTTSVVLSDAATTAFSQLQAALAADGKESAANFSRFGIPLGDGKRSAFFSVNARADGARITSVYAYGTAARAGIQVNDDIVALDGVRLSGLAADEVERRFNDHPDPQYICTVLESDGRAVNVVFSAEDIRWYLEHPAKKRSL